MPLNKKIGPLIRRLMSRCRAFSQCRHATTRGCFLFLFARPENRGETCAMLLLWVIRVVGVRMGVVGELASMSRKLRDLTQS